MKLEFCHVMQSTLYDDVLFKLLVCFVAICRNFTTSATRKIIYESLLPFLQYDQINSFSEINDLQILNYKQVAHNSMFPLIRLHALGYS